MNLSTPRAFVLPLLSVLLVATTAAGCGNSVDAEIVGRTAVAVDRSGLPIAVVQVCSGRIDTVELVGDRTGLADDEPNPVIGAWRADEASKVSVELPLGAGAPGWTGPTDLDLAAGRTYVLTASDSSRDAETSQVSFTTDQLRALGAHEVITGDGEVRPRSELDECEK